MKVIAASAGTGKTTRLAQEYLERLVDHPPHRLAAVTFTRRAAAELKGRIFRALENSGLEGITLPQALESRREELAARVLEAPLDTIHGFSELILRLAAPLMGLDPGLQVGDPGRIEGWFLEVARGVAIARGRVLTEGDESALLTLFKGRVLAEAFHPHGPESAELLDLMQEALEIHRRRTRRLLHPGDAERLAAKLVENPDATARVAARLKAVLVDEYQDTNPMQQALFEGLDAAGVEVVVVGDPKQSIFGFRNAVPEGFRRAIGKSAEVHHLDKSYRHPEKLARLLNAFTAQEAELGTPGFDGARPVTGVADREGKSYFAIREIRRSNGLSTEQARALEARLASHILLHWVKQGIPLREIMVLVTKRHHARPLLKELRELGLPYAVQGGTDLYQEPEVQELGHLLRFALAGFQADSVSLAALLTGPFVELDPGVVSELLKQKEPAAWIRARYPEAWKRIEGIRDTFKDRPAGAALSRLVSERSYLEQLDETIADSVVMALSRLARYEDPGEALAALESLRVHGEEGLLARSDGDAIWVVTVHSAKGLQAHSVLVFGAGNAFRARKPPLLIEPGTGRMALDGEPAYAELWESEKVRQQEEWRRLLYVALSRARVNLVVTGIENKEGAKGPHKEPTWLRILKGVELRAFRSLDPADVETSVAKIRAEIDRRQEVTAVARPGVPPALPKFPPALASPSRAAEEIRLKEPDPESDEAVRRLRAQVVGTLVHAGIERDWRPDDLHAVLPRERIYSDLPPDEKQAVRDEVTRFLTTYRAMLEDGRLVPLKARTNDRKEVPVAFERNEQAWFGVIDRLFEHEGVLYIEDYKTDREPNPEAHLVQLALYRDAVARALGRAPVVRLVFLATGEVVELTEADLEAALSAAG